MAYMLTWVFTEMGNVPTLLRVNSDRKYTAMLFLQVKVFHLIFSNSSWKQDNMLVKQEKPYRKNGILLHATIPVGVKYLSKLHL